MDAIVPFEILFQTTDKTHARFATMLRVAARQYPQKAGATEAQVFGYCVCPKVDLLRRFDAYRYAEKTMHKMSFTMILWTLIFLGTFATADATTDEVYKIGISVWTGYPTSVKGFKESLAAGGLVEGKNVEYLYGKSDIDQEKQRRIATWFKEEHVDLVYSLTTPGTAIVKEVLPSDTPIVFSIVTYPADAGLIESFEYSGNNLVGTSNYVPLFTYVKLLQTMLPTAKSVAIFHRKGEPNSKIQAANVIRLLKKAGIRPIDLEPTSVDEMRQMALEVSGEADVFMTTTDTLCQGGGERALVEISRAKKIPILSSNKIGVEEGSTFGPVADFYTLGKMAGEMAVKILRDGISPARLQSKIMEPPLTLVNRDGIKRLGLTVPEHKLANLRYTEPKPE